MSYPEGNFHPIVNTVTIGITIVVTSIIIACYMSKFISIVIIVMNFCSKTVVVIITIASAPTASFAY